MSADSLSPRDGPLAVHMQGINKRFGAVAANADVELCVRPGTVHGIVGENGAGKSTLMSILYGFYQADSGTVDVFGRRVTIRNADDAIAQGIGMVHQHFMLVDTLTGLLVKLDALVADLPVGDRQRLEILKALHFADYSQAERSDEFV